MKKIAWKPAACFCVALLLCLPILTGCDMFPKSSKGLEFTSNGDGTCYVSGIGECTDADIVIPKKSPEGDRVKSIGIAAFRDCIGLTSITILDSVTSIGDMAFEGCTSLMSITIPDSVTYIGGKAFSSCHGLTSIVIPDGVTRIGEMVFKDCTGLANIEVAESNSVYHSQGNCIIETESKILIAGCQNSVIPDDGSVTSIGWGAFKYCGLTSITIPDSVTRIEDEAFAGCTGLTSITIPDSVTRIDDKAFANCTGLKDVTYTGTRLKWSTVDVGLGNKLLRSATIHCTDGDITP